MINLNAFFRGGALPRAGRVVGLAVVILLARPALAGVEDFELGLHYNAAFPQLELSPMEFGQSYGVHLHYWLTDLTSIDAAFDWFTSAWPVEVDQDTKHLDFEMWLVSAGLRYQPEVDFFLAPYAGAGIGYQQWNTRSSLDGVKNRKGDGVAVYTLLGAEYRLTRRISLGPWARVFYLPLQGKMEQEVRAGIATDKTHLDQGMMITTGLEFTVRIR